MGFPGGAVVKNPPANAGDTRDADSILGLGRSRGTGNGNPIQYSLPGEFHGGGWWPIQSMGSQRVGHD